MSFWNDRYAGKNYVFGREPADFLIDHKDFFQPDQSVLAVADGEGLNGVYLARLGLHVHSVDGSENALAKARQLADEYDVTITTELADLKDWEWPTSAYDIVLGIFIQFADPEWRSQMFAGMKQALKPGGVLMLHGYRPEQVWNGTGGPSDPEYMYTVGLLRSEFADLDILEIYAEDKIVAEGVAHRGQSALISLIARKLISDSV
ncbi:MAG: class I SAM-dependent methyltransferase [Thermomicrobiales bacterium]|nr:class I SAM-dependent methyltransferase [Thermomicrobiales bacterium]